MTPDEVARLLAKCAAFDSRTVGRADVLAWHETVGDLDPETALRAVSRWYRDNDERINPASLRRAYIAVQGTDRRAFLDQAHDAKLRALDEVPVQDRTADVKRLLKPQQTHNLTLRRRDTLGRVWAYSCSCGLNPVLQEYPSKTDARSAGQDHIPAAVATSAA